MRPILPRSGRSSTPARLTARQPGSSSTTLGSCPVFSSSATGSSESGRTELWSPAEPEPLWQRFAADLPARAAAAADLQARAAAAPLTLAGGPRFSWHVHIERAFHP